MWHLVYGALLVVCRVATHSHERMRNGIAMQHCCCMYVFMCGLETMRNGNTMQHVYGDYISVGIVGYFLIVLYFGFNRVQSHVQRTWLMRNGNAMQQCYCVRFCWYKIYNTLYEYGMSMCGARSCVHKGRGLRNGDPMQNCPHGSTGKGKGFVRGG